MSLLLSSMLAGLFLRKLRRKKASLGAFRRGGGGELPSSGGWVDRVPLNSDCL